MSAAPPLRPFQAGFPDAVGVLSWVHIGDLHMTKAGEQNDLDLNAIVDEINRSFAGSLSFVYIPGDVADDGSASAYTVVRQALDRLTTPWCSIIGDHDVHEKSLDNYLEFMAHSKHYSFQVNGLRFVALNAFDIPDPAHSVFWINSSIGLRVNSAKQSGTGNPLFFFCTAIPQTSSKAEADCGNLSRVLPCGSSIWGTPTTTSWPMMDEPFTRRPVRQARSKKGRLAFLSQTSTVRS
jgi:hypothetical protein